MYNSQQKMISELINFSFNILIFFLKQIWKCIVFYKKYTISLKKVNLKKLKKII